MISLWRRFTGLLLSIGQYPEETQEQQGKRRIFVIAATIGGLGTLLFIPDTIDLGQTQVAVAAFLLDVAIVLILFVGLKMRPHWFPWLVHGIFTLITLQQLYKSMLLGGLIPSSLEVMFGLSVALGALLILGRKEALIWFGVFVFQVVFAMVIPTYVEPTYAVTDTTGTSGFNLIAMGVLIITSGFNLIAMGVLIMAVTLYFVRQRDRYQKESDDLLHNILPDEIATRLKTDPAMIADAFPAASVLFTDVVGFTPMTAEMSPPELVGLLNAVFTTFDQFVEELGLEKIKTVGDEYMVAAGVPLRRSDHADALAELAIRIRDHVSNNDFDGHTLSVRIGINSGPVVAGIIGTHKFSYDMWGDTVNTASRMESEGIPGDIQITQATYELIRDRYECEQDAGRGRSSQNTIRVIQDLTFRNRDRSSHRHDPSDAANSARFDCHGAEIVDGEVERRIPGSCWQTGVDRTSGSRIEEAGNQTSVNSPVRVEVKLIRRAGQLHLAVSEAGQVERNRRLKWCRDLAS
jgi:guanylate cyclase